ncbi:MAG: helix-turn-helix transcriptional regulator [Ruminococcaceae bacterium]|nr:helix-turn-helix transcriptional regulator [Oscillospiraceae bacterium]
MKLNIAQNLRKYRKERGLTQEQLAKELAISAQSVSKWECGDGYPDIELLPNIANHLKISVDALLGNDTAGKKEDLKYFWDQLLKNDGFPGSGDLRDQRIQFAEAYWRKYPEEYRIAAEIVQQLCFGKGRNPEKYRPLLYEAAEKIIAECDDPILRGNVLRDICAVCTDEDLDRWLRKCTYEYNSCRFEVLEERYWGKVRDEWLNDEEPAYEKALEEHRMNNLRLACHALNRDIVAVLPPDVMRAQYTEYRRLIESFAEDGETVPQGWLSFYIGCGLRLAAAYFGKGEDDIAYNLLERSFDEYEEWKAIPENTPLSLGRHDLFGDIRAEKGKWWFLRPNGEKDQQMVWFNLVHLANTALELLASLKPEYRGRQNWASQNGLPRKWFDSVVQTPKFGEYAARAEELLGRPSSYLLD